MNTVEQALNLPMSFLLKGGYLKGDSKYGGITWSVRGERTGDINFWVSGRDMNIRFLYSVKDRFTGESQHMDYKVPLLKTPCHYGGFRYWLQCPCCYRRVGVLYINTYARCRKCSRLCYASQKASRIERSIGANGYMFMLHEERQSIRTMYYAGRPTKRYLRFLKREEKAERGFASMRFLL